MRHTVFIRPWRMLQGRVHGGEHRRKWFLHPSRSAAPVLVPNILATCERFAACFPSRSPQGRTAVEVVFKARLTLFHA